MTRSTRATPPALPALLLTTALALGQASTPAIAQSEETPEDWPCVQRLVPEVVLSVLWPVPIDPTLADTWRRDPEIRVLAQRLGELERVDADALAAMDAYAASVPEPERRGALTRLAEGVVSVANVRRSSYIDGIRRFTRQQIAIAGQIESTLNRLAELDDAAAAGQAGDVDAAGRAEIEETLAWHERLYDQRERGIRALCERPVALEQTLAETLRELSYRLPDA